MPRHAKSEDAARNGFAPANLAPVAAAARPGLALEPRQGRDGNDGFAFGSHKGLADWARADRPGRAARR